MNSAIDQHLLDNPICANTYNNHCFKILNTAKSLQLRDLNLFTPPANTIYIFNLKTKNFVTFKKNLIQMKLSTFLFVNLILLIDKIVFPSR